MKTKLIKAVVRKSGAGVYFGRCRMVKAYREGLTHLVGLTGSNGCAPAQISTRQRYMKISAL